VSSYITDPANKVYDFGKGFNYAVWTEGTVVTLTNVPWNNDYRDLCQFPNATGKTLDQYIDSNVLVNDTIRNVSYIKFNVPIRINVPFNAAFKFNYLRVQNPLEPIANDVLKSYYYFILDVKYIAPNTTELTIQLDVFQSFRTDFTFGNSYIERGHIGIANENAFNNYGRDYLTVPEGIDYGGEYRVINVVTETVMDLNTADISAQPVIMIITSVDITADAGTASAPVLHSATGASIDNIPSGANVYYFLRPEPFFSFMNNFSVKPWVTQGIMSITYVPNIARYGNPETFYQPVTGITGLYTGTWNAQSRVTPLKPNWRQSTDIVNQIPARYRTLKKFLTYPYLVIEMTTWTGTPVVLKPESWTDDNATVVERASYGPPNQRVQFYPQRYNAIPNSIIETSVHGAGDDKGEYLDITTMIANFPTMNIVNNSAIGYLASNFAGIPYSRQSANWSASRALRGNEVSYDQTNKGVQASKNINALQNAGVGAQAANQNLLIANQQAVTGIGGVIQATASAGLGMSNGNIGLSGIANAVGNQVMGAITSGNQQDANTAGSNITQQVSRGANTGANNQTSYVNDTNKSLADWSARGDYENTIAGINAQVSDASMIQPTTSGQQGGETINLVNSSCELSLRFKFIDNAAFRTVGNYWLRYGYAIQQFAPIPASLMVMSKFTYWKLQETYIVSSAMPEGFKQIIRGIFEKGVTVWADPSYIGNTDLADNTPLAGFTL
jgi:hypothetical protein